MAESQEQFDVVVVGGGLIGSAASRHLTEAGHNVVVVASTEPADWARHDGPFASHYDSGRITRIMSADPVWAELAARSAARYRDIEQRSGISFYTPCGLAWLGTDIATAVNNAAARGGEARMVTADFMLATTGIRIPDIDGMTCAIERAPAGVVDPRQMAAAQLKLAEMAGATVIRHAATGVQATGHGVSVTGAFGSIRADRALVATGAYSADSVGVDLGLDRQLRTTVRIDMGPAPDMPSVIADQVEHAYMNDMYSNPPVRYPDGSLLFKIGCEIIDPPRAESAADITRWFHSNGDPEEAAALVATTRQIFPGAAVRSWHAVPCVITRTRSKYPSIGWVGDNVAVAVGGNGSSAKSSDELGRLASTLFSEQGWVDSELSASTFAPQVAA